MNIVFDLDGTLIDSKLRLFRLFEFLAPDSTLSYDEYWSFKKNEISNEWILASLFGFDEKSIKEFDTQWMALIESPQYLQLDRNFAGIEVSLGNLQQRANLHLCTDRQLRQPVLDQLENLNLLQFFEQTLVTEKRVSKGELIVANIPDLSSNDWMVGDTGHDMLVGKSLNMKTCAVLSGFLSREVLCEYHPTDIRESVVNLFPSFGG